MAKKFFSGNTLEQAVLQAARHFQLEPEEVAYQQVERRHGFLKVRRRVVIGVDPESPGQPEGAPAVEAAPSAATALAAGSEERPESQPKPTSSSTVELDSEPLSAEKNREDTASADTQSLGRVARFGSHNGENPWGELSRADGLEAAEEGLRRLFRLGGLELEAEVDAADTGISAELSGPDEDQLFEDRGRLLLAIEHLLPRLVRGLTGVSVPCRVDSDNFQEVRAEQLRVMAQDAAAGVREDRRMQTLEPMSPDERRIVHLTLADDPAVETESHGTGLFKRVAIKPVHRRSRAYE